MTGRSARCAPLLVLPLLLPLAAGCVERSMVITSEPYGAVVYDERQLPLSSTPADKSFVYYGKYRFTLVKDGYETLVVEEDVPPPWYEWLGLDFISENVIPWTIRDQRRFHYKLQLAHVFPTQQVLDQGAPLRAKGQTIGEALPPEPVGGRPAPTEPPGILSNPGQPLLQPPVGMPQPR
jgi:PEGA domain